MSKTEHAMLSDAGLEAFFEVGRAEAPEPGESLMARIMADAEAEASARERPRKAPRAGLLAGVLAAVGGWPALAGMVTAALAGIWLGFASPDELNALAGGLILNDGSTGSVSYDVDEIVPGGAGFGILLEEG